MTESARRIKTVAMIGTGTMGTQIAALAAFAGYPVAIFDAMPGAAESSLDRMRTEILPSIAGAGLGPSSVEDALGRIRIAPSLADAVGNVDLVIEAIREEIETKKALFGELSTLAPNAILATNSSSLPSAPLAEMVDDPSRVLNMHFFAPIWIRSMLELMTSGQTSDAVFDAAERFGRSLGLVVARVQGESKGFIINRIWRAVKRESLAVVDQGHATPEDVDRLFMIFFQSPYSPFGVMDMVGLDVVADIETSYQNVTKDPTDVASPTLHRMVREGKLGEKTGQGFYSHPNPAYAQPGFLKPSREE